MPDTDPTSQAKSRPGLRTRVAAYLTTIGIDPSDDIDQRLQKSLLVICAIPFALAGFLWGVLYFALGQPVAAAIPFGTVSPLESFDPTAVLLLRRNFGDISLWGLDTHFTLYPSRQLQVSGFYSYVSDNYFFNVDGVEDISLNAPRHKAGGSVLFRGGEGAYTVSAGARFVDAYPVKSDIYIGDVDRFVVFDASARYDVPFSGGTSINLTIQNITNNKHREFVSVAEIGRLAILRLTHEF